MLIIKLCLFERNFFVDNLCAHPFLKSCVRYWACLKEVKHLLNKDYVQKIKKYFYFFTKFQLSTSFLRYFISRLGVLPNSVAIRNLIFYELGYAIYIVKVFLL